MQLSNCRRFVLAIAVFTCYLYAEPATFSEVTEELLSGRLNAPRNLGMRFVTV
jgi:hypothetical protein